MFSWKRPQLFPNRLTKPGDNQTRQELPDELQTLVEEAKVVNNSQQVQDLQQLLIYYRDVFSTKDEPLGQSDFFQHDIQTTGEPIKSQYCIIPVGLRV